MLIHALGCLGAALSMSLSWPQVYKSCVQRHTNGLSPTACALGVALPLGWIIYGLLSGQRLQVVTNTVTTATGLLIIIALLLTRPNMRSLRVLRLSLASAGAVILAAFSAVVAAALPAVPGAEAAKVLGLLLAGVSLVSAVPQPLSLLRDRRQDLSGLSPLRFKLGVGAASSWLLYGLSTGQAAVSASAAVGLVSTGIVCTVLFLRREPRPVTAQAAAVRWRDSVTTRPLAMAGI